MQFGWGMMAGQISAQVPPTVVDSKRLYGTWFGSCFALDQRTGKLLWRTNWPDNLAQQIQQSVMRGSVPDMHVAGIQLAGDCVLAVCNSITANQNDQINHLLCLNAQSGKLLWSSEKNALNIYSFLGQPMLHDQQIFVVAKRANSQDLVLLCINLADAKLLWEAPLGTASFGTDFRGQVAVEPPSLLLHGQTLFVLTNNGALLAINQPNGQLLWAFTYPTKFVQSENNYYDVAITPKPITPGAMLCVGSTLYLKETSLNRLYALDVFSANLKWKRSVDDSCTLAGGDEQNLYLIGTDLDCIDVQTRDLKWSDKLAIGTGDLRPLIEQDRFIVLGKRGIQALQTADGQSAPLFRGSERQSLGGAIWHSGDKLICVSNLAITAYPVSSANSSTQPGEP